jgi:uncharacterized protein YbjT (DUF2867 family)
MSPILVIGATGAVGRAVVGELAARGAAVRALTHTAGLADPPAGVEVVRGDLTEPASLEPALTGVEAVFLLWPSPVTATAPAVVTAIGRHARRVVYLSSMSVRDGGGAQADPISASHAELERLIESAGPEWTFLRAGGFATNTLAWADDVRAGDVVRAPYGAMARSLIHERDIAAVAARALTEDGHAGVRHVLTGPEAITQVEQVRLIGEAVGRPLRFEQMPPSRARRQMLDRGWPASVADAVLGAWAAMTREPEPVTGTVEKVTGTPARTFGRWARDHAADFGAPRPA